MSDYHTVKEVAEYQGLCFKRFKWSIGKRLYVDEYGDSVMINPNDILELEDIIADDWVVCV